MRKKIMALLCGLLCLSAVALPAFAGTGDVGLGLKLGSLGVGVELTAGLVERLNARFNINGFTYQYDTTIDDIDYDFDLQMLTAGLLLDWHPFYSGFRLSAGAYFNTNTIDLVGNTDAPTIIIDDTAYPSVGVGNLNGTVDFNEIAPYIGIGWGNAADASGSAQFSFDLGVMFQGEPKADLNADGPLASDPGLQNSLANEARDIEKDTEAFQYYPVIYIGVSYAF